jgi:hypothetical protein
MNVVELSQDEVSVVSGGSLLGSFVFIGGMVLLAAYEMGLFSNGRTGRSKQYCMRVRNKATVERYVDNTLRLMVVALAWTLCRAIY